MKRGILLRATPGLRAFFVEANMTKFVLGGITLRLRPHQSAAEIILPAQIQAGFYNNFRRILGIAEGRRCPQLVIRCNGGGGLIEETSAAMKLLVAWKFPTITLVASGRGYDRADSGHACLWLAGKQRLMMPGTQLAFHAAQYERGQAPKDAFRKGLNVGITHGIFQVAARQPLPLAWFGEEYTLVSAAEAAKLGLCEVVTGSYTSKN